MIRLEKYRSGRRPYAVNLGSFRVRHEVGDWPDNQGGLHHYDYYVITIDAVWFRGKVATPEACAGVLTWSVKDDPLNGADAPDPWALQTFARRAVEAHADGRYGGDTIAKLRSDGTMWTADSLRAADVLALEDRLAPVLQGFPQVPEGYDGWWTFVPER